MILADTSIWIDHLRGGDARLAELLESGLVSVHPFVIGELALGNLKNREVILGSLQDLPSVVVAEHAEALNFIEHHALFGFGIGYVDVHLLAAVRLTPDTTLWTRDKRLRAAAAKLNIIASVRSSASSRQIIR